MQNPGGAATHSSAPSVASTAEGNGARAAHGLQAERAAAAARHGLETAQAARARRRDRDLDDFDEDTDSIFGGDDEEAPEANGISEQACRRLFPRYQTGSQGGEGVCSCGRLESLFRGARCCPAAALAPCTATCPQNAACSGERHQNSLLPEALRAETPAGLNQVAATFCNVKLCNTAA